MTGPVAEWAERGSCRTVDPEAFFPESRGQGGAPAYGYALAVCRRCPVVNECREYAVTTDQGEGVWGATTPRDRHWIRIERGLDPTPVCPRGHAIVGDNAVQRGHGRMQCRTCHTDHSRASRRRRRSRQ